MSHSRPPLTRLSQPPGSRFGHLKFKAVSLAVVILVSWGIAFVEYCFAVPANRIGSAVYSPFEAVHGLALHAEGEELQGQTGSAAVRLATLPPLIVEPAPPLGPPPAMPESLQEPAPPA